MVYVVLGVFKLQNAAKIFSPLRCRTQKWHWKMKQLRCCIFLLFISFRITFGMLHHAPKVVGMRLSIQPDTTLCINMHHNELHDVTCDHCILLRLKIFSISCRYDVLTHFAWIHVCIFIYIYIHIFFNIIGYTYNLPEKKHQTLQGLKHPGCHQRCRCRAAAERCSAPAGGHAELCSSPAAAADLWCFKRHADACRL